MRVKKIFNSLKHLKSLLDCGEWYKTGHHKILVEKHQILLWGRIFYFWEQDYHYFSHEQVPPVRYLHYRSQRIGEDPPLVSSIYPQIRFVQWIYLNLSTALDTTDYKTWLSFLFHVLILDIALKLVLYCSHHNWEQEFLLYQSFDWGLFSFFFFVENMSWFMWSEQQDHLKARCN